MKPSLSNGTSTYLLWSTMIEDQMQRDELAGYADYTARVRYRLIPSVW
jgi:protein-S-isoprenylcysteine O-methyltransferase Ste14